MHSAVLESILPYANGSCERLKLMAGINVEFIFTRRLRTVSFSRLYDCDYFSYFESPISLLLKSYCGFRENLILIFANDFFSLSLQYPNASFPSWCLLTALLHHLQWARGQGDSALSLISPPFYHHLAICSKNGDLFCITAIISCVAVRF